MTSVRSSTTGIRALSHCLVSSVVGIMGIVGNFVAPILMTKFGRQKAHLISTIPALLGWVIFFLGSSVPMFLLARLLHGLALGLRTPIAAILVAEYTDPAYRGAFLGTFAISLGAGILLSHVWGAHLTWTVTAAVCAMFPLLAMAIISLSPESPSWLISKGKFDEAKKSFRWLRGEGTEQQTELDSMIDSQKNTMKLEREQRIEIDEKVSIKRFLKNIVGGLKDFFKIITKKEFFKPSIIAICMLIVFEFGGAHMIPAYGNLILQGVLDKKDPSEVNLQFTIVDLLRTVSAFAAIFLLKQFKRRTILFTSGVMTVLSMSLVSLFMYLRNEQLFEKSWILETVPMGLMVLYTLSFCLGIVPLNWVICGEVFPLAYRNIGSTISTSFLTPSFLISMKTAPHLFSSIGIQGAFLVYAAVLLVCLSIMYLLLPETKDKTLQQIEDSFKGKESNDPEVEMRLMDKNEVVLR